MAFLNFRRCRDDSTCGEARIPSQTEVTETLLPKMEGRDLVILSYTKVTRCVAFNEVVLALTAAEADGDRHYSILVCGNLFSDSKFVLSLLVRWCGLMVSLP